MPRRPPLAPVLVALGYTLLIVAWCGGNPLFSAPDEQAHYYRATGLAAGQLVGTPTGGLFASDVVRAAGGNPDDPAIRWQDRTTRFVTIRRDRLALGRECYAFKPELPATCLYGPRWPSLDGSTSTVGTTTIGTVNGTYQPFALVPAAVGIRIGPSMEDAALLGRLAGGLVCAALLAAAALLLWDPEVGARSLAGLFLAATPMTLFLAGSINPSGQEGTAAICFLAALLRIGRGSPDRPPPRWAFVAAGAGGAALGWSKSLGTGFVVLLVLAAVGAVGPRRLSAAVRSGGRWAAGAAAAVVAGAVLGAGWEAAVQPHAGVDPALAQRSFSSSVGMVPDWISQLVGRFGYLDTRLPQAATTTWILLVLVTVVVAAAAGTRSQRLTVVGGVAALVVLLVAVDCLVMRQVGYGGQGRHVIALGAAIPLAAVEVVLRRRSQLGAADPSRLGALVGVPVAVVLFVAFWTNARRYAVGTDGPILFLGHSAWHPRGGWEPWLALAGLGAGAILLAATGALDRVRSR